MTCSKKLPELQCSFALLLINLNASYYYKPRTILQANEDDVTGLCPREAFLHDQNVKSVHERVVQCELLWPGMPIVDNIETDYPLAFSILVHG